MKYLKIKYIDKCSDRQLLLPEEMIEKFEFLPKKLILNIGSFKRELNIIFTSSLDENCIGLSKTIFKTFSVPDTLEYEVKLEGRNLCLGPVICFLVSIHKKYITASRLENLKVYYNNYNNIKGLIFISASDQINIQNKTIEGFYYNGESFEEGIFPYPGAVYRKTDIPQCIYDDLINCIGDKLFNSYFFNKWETWETLSPCPLLKEHIPHTKKLDNLETLDEMLKLHQIVYLKQMKGCKGKGIIKAEKTEEGYKFTYRLKGTITISDSQEAENFIKELNEGNKRGDYYIVQQSIIVKKYQERPFDFRVVMQKDKAKQWGSSGIIARFGKRKSIATNFLLSGYALPIHDALKKVFKMTEKEIFLKEQEIVSICMEACRVLENTIGNYGDLGIDVIMDSNKNVWVLEINKLHDHKFPLYSINDTEMYHRIISKPFEYAKALAGF